MESSSSPLEPKAFVVLASVAFGFRGGFWFSFFFLVGVCYFIGFWFCFCFCFLCLVCLFLLVFSMFFWWRVELFADVLLKLLFGGMEVECLRVFSFLFK